MLPGAALVAAFVLASAASACDTPAVVAMPDGKTSTKEQMLAARDQVKAYMKGMEDFMKCVDDEAAAKSDATAEYKDQMAARHNNAVSEMEAVAAAFNDQLHAYNAAHPAPPK